MAEPVADERRAVVTSVPTRLTAMHLIAFLLALAALRYSREFLAPVFVAVLMAVALAPPVRQLSRVMPRWLASALVVIGIFSSFAFTAWLLSDEIAAFSRRLPAIVREVRSTIQSASPRQGLVRQLQQAVTELEQSTTTPKPTDATKVTIVEPVDVQRQMMNVAQRAGEWLMQAILLMFLVYFLLATGEMFKEKFVKLSGNRLSERKVTVQMIDEMTGKIGRYIFYLFWSGTLVGVLTWLTFWAMGVRYAGLWGVAAGVLNCIPYFGPTVVMAASAFAALRAIQVGRDDGVGRGRLGGDHVARGIFADADLSRRGRARELGGGVRVGDVLGMDVGHTRHAAGGAHPDDGENRQRPRRVAVERRRVAVER